MKDQVTFESVHVCNNEKGDVYVVKDAFSGVPSGWFNDKVGADKRRDYANAEHANGRVAQCRCQLGHACDRDRIHVPRMLRPAVDVVLCKVHEDEIDQVRGCGL